MTWGVISICRACHPPLPCILVQLSGVGDKPGPFSPGRNHCYIPTNSTADFPQMPALSPLAAGLRLYCSLCLEPSSLPFLLFKAKLECHIFHEALFLPSQHNILYIYHLFIHSQIFIESMAMYQLIWQGSSLWESFSLTGGNVMVLDCPERHIKDDNTVWYMGRKGEQLGLAYSKHFINKIEQMHLFWSWVNTCHICGFSAHFEHLCQVRTFSAFRNPPPQGGYVVSKPHGGMMNSVHIAQHSNLKRVGFYKFFRIQLNCSIVVKP